jgi:predicted ABC-type transport system involved in lysophospholipase L1 biosynthesis ATPase subunit
MLHASRERHRDGAPTAPREILSLDDVTLQVAEGEAVAVIGASRVGNPGSVISVAFL